MGVFIKACCLSVAFLITSVSVSYAQEITSPPEAHAKAEHAARLDASIKAIGYQPVSLRRTGDLDMMEEFQTIRVLTAYSLGQYYMVGDQQKGVTYELFKQFEDYVNQTLRQDERQVQVVFVPVDRNELIDGLHDGRGDIAAQLTITPELEKLIAFSEPASKEVSEVLVTGPSAPSIASIDDLSGKVVYVRASSSYRVSLDATNARLKLAGKAPIKLIDADERLEDDDLLEMVNQGLLQWAVVDDYQANLWSGVFNNMVVRNDIVFRKGGRIGFGVRKDNPMLVTALNQFLKTHRQGTLHGNLLINRNLRESKWTQNDLAKDYPMLADRGYYESK